MQDHAVDNSCDASFCGSFFHMCKSAHEKWQDQHAGNGILLFLSWFKTNSFLGVTNLLTTETQTIETLAKVYVFC